MKKILIFSLTIFTAFTLTACMSDNLPEEEEVEEPTTSEAVTEEISEDTGNSDESSKDPGVVEVSPEELPMPMPIPEEPVTKEMDVEVTTSSEPSEEPVEEATEPEEPEPAAPVVKTFSMTAKQWEFTPSTITVNKGDQVVLSITSTDVKHGFAIPAFGVNVDLNPNQTTTVRFTADQAGTHKFRCSVLCGSGHGGMTGTLIVK